MVVVVVMPAAGRGQRQTQLAVTGGEAQASTGATGSRITWALVHAEQAALLIALLSGTAHVVAMNPSAKFAFFGLKNDLATVLLAPAELVNVTP